MPKLVCSCGAAYPVTDEEAQRLNGKEFRCAKCRGAQGQPTLTPVRRNAAPKPARAASASPSPIVFQSIGKPKRIEGIDPANDDAMLQPEGSNSTTLARKQTVGLKRALWPVLFILLGLIAGWFLFGRREHNNGREPLRQDIAAKPADNAGNAPVAKNPILAKILPDPEKAAVKEWLRLHLDDPDWSEVRWWPCREMIEIKNAQAKVLKDELERQRKWNEKTDAVLARKNEFLKKVDIDQRDQWEITQRNSLEGTQRNIALLQKEIAELNAKPALRCCRIRYRSKTPFGGLKMWDRMFVIQDDGTVRECSQSEKADGKEYFPE